MQILKDGFGYLEGARWYDGSLWFSDIKEKTVYRMSEDGEIEHRWRVAARPSGLGFSPAGDLLVVSMEDSRLLKISREDSTMIADLSDIAIHPNDMAVDRAGRAYISQFGFDLFGGGAPATCGVLVVEADGETRIQGSDLTFPNGLAITANGKQLVVAESFGGRLSVFDIHDNGDLGPRRDFAVFGDPAADVPDGLCLDANDAVWVGCPFAGEFRHINSNGEIIDRVIPKGDGTYCVACALGGADGRTLFMLVADTDVDRLANDWDSSAWVATTRVETPGIYQ